MTVCEKCGQDIPRCEDCDMDCVSCETFHEYGDCREDSEE